MSLLFEWEDKPWFPNRLRKMQTEYIGWLVHVMMIYKPLLKKFESWRKKTGFEKVIDLCSGSGWPIKHFAKKLPDIPFYLTDLYPNGINFQLKNIIKIDGSRNALAGPMKEDGECIYTLFNGFHHFNEQEKIDLIKMYGEKGIWVCEVIEKRILTFIKIFITTTLVQFILAPFIRPFSLRRILFTWVLPINIFTVCWDGIVSVMKADKKEDFFNRAVKHAPINCAVETGTFGKPWARGYYFWIYLDKHV